MDNDSGRGSRSDQPPPLATVRPLHLNEVAPDAGAAEDDWYETERLTGQITGRAGSAAATEGRAVAPVPSPALDWRYADPEPAPSAAQRLRRGLDRRRGPRPALRLPSAERWLRRHRRATATRVAASLPSEVPVLAAPEAVADRNKPARPLLGFRHSSEHQDPELQPALSARIREQIPRPAWRRSASIVAIVLVMVAAATIGIAAALEGSPAKPRRAAVAASGSRHTPDLGAAAKVLTAAVGVVEHEVRGIANAHHAVRARTARRTKHPRSRGAHQHRQKGQSGTAAAPPASAASSDGSSSSSPAYSGSTSAQSTSSQPVTSQSAPATSTQHSQSTQPPFGQNGTLGPGRGAPGTQ
jgi:hypothetical protein